MDQNASYETSVKNHCPNAAVVYDLFHMIAKFGLTVLSQIRTQLALKYKDEGNRTSTMTSKAPDGYYLEITEI